MKKKPEKIPMYEDPRGGGALRCFRHAASTDTIVFVAPPAPCVTCTPKGDS